MALLNFPVSMVKLYRCLVFIRAEENPTVCATLRSSCQTSGNPHHVYPLKAGGLFGPVVPPQRTSLAISNHADFTFGLGSRKEVQHKAFRLRVHLTVLFLFPGLR